jgi:hypothetical protein
MAKAERETLRMIEELPEEQRRYVERMSDEDTRAFLAWRAQMRAEDLMRLMEEKTKGILRDRSIEQQLARVDRVIDHELRFR